MHARRAACTALLALAALTAGCSSHHTDSKAPSTPSHPGKGSPSAKVAAGPLRFGQAVSWAHKDTNGNRLTGTSTVLGYTQPAQEVTLPKRLHSFPKAVWAVLEVKVCADSTSAPVAVSQAPWELGFPDDTRLDSPNISGPGVAEPEYAPNEASVNAGSCLRGKITYSVRQGTRPNRVLYAAPGQAPVEWSIPKA